MVFVRTERGSDCFDRVWKHNRAVCVVRAGSEVLRLVWEGKLKEMAQLKMILLIYF